MSAQVANPITWAKVHSLGKEVLDDLVSFIQLFDRIYLVSKPVTDAEAGEREFVVSVIGRDPHGYLGLGQKVTVVGQPTQLKQLNGVELVKIMAGGPNNTSRAFFVALDRTGRVWLWGSNLEGQVKPTQRGNHVYKPIELCLFMSKPIVDIAVGESHVLAMDSDGEIKAWGWNGHGQLGQGNVSRYTDVVTVFLDRQNVPPAKSIKAGGNRSMALSRFNRLYIWGAGQAGGRPIEVEFDSLPKEIGLAFTGKQEICLILDDEGKLLASAHPDDGKLGTDCVCNLETNREFYFPVHRKRLLPAEDRGGQEHRAEASARQSQRTSRGGANGRQQTLSDGHAARSRGRGHQDGRHVDGERCLRIG